ncbi:MAG: CDP-diacylglycerol--serine O-phosphatidyltransferase [Planctomycetes bacterium]|nr:CDP-diacylglycerol--serine O-phosphatidyltransferase [Planctomycetota bacterium]
MREIGRLRLKGRILKRVAILPALLTLGNGISGFTSVVQASRDHLEAASWLIFLGMIFDALDGKVARMTKVASNFGAQLDSLCDAITFGLAPAFLALKVVSTPRALVDANFVWMVCALYLSCAILRLARFTVETSPDETAHEEFKGLPSPGAAGVVASFVLICPDFAKTPSTVLSDTLQRLLPFAVLVAGLLMISRLRYVHMVNRLFRGHRPFASLIEVLLVVLLIALNPQMTLFLAFFGYAAVGPFRYLRSRWFPRPANAPEAGPGAGAEEEEELI